jgi:hypothetical protein
VIVASAMANPECLEEYVALALAFQAVKAPA